MTMAQRDADPERTVQFLFDDNQYDARNTVSSVQKLLALNNVKGLVVFGSNPSVAVAGMVEHARIPMISISTSADVVKGRQFIVRHHLNSETEGLLLAQEIARRKYASLAIVTTQNDGVLTVRDDLVRRIGDKIVLNEEAAPAEREFSGLASRIKQINPAAALLCMMPPQVGILARRLKEISYGGDIVGCHPLEVDPESQTAAGSLVGAWFVGTDERAAADFFKRYRQEFGAKAPIIATNGYDIAVLFIRALQSGDANRYLHSVKDFSGTLGRYGASGNSSFDFAGAIRLVTPTGLEYR